MEKKDKNKVLECQLKEEDWEELITMHGILYSFWELTLSMQANIATQIREEVGDEMPETVYGKPNASLFNKRPRPNPGLSRPASNEDGALLNVLPAFDRILSTLEEARK